MCWDIDTVTGWFTSRKTTNGTCSKQAVEWGLITGDGYLTPEGQAFIAAYGDS